MRVQVNSLQTIGSKSYAYKYTYCADGWYLNFIAIAKNSVRSFAHKQTHSNTHTSVYVASFRKDICKICHYAAHTSHIYRYIRWYTRWNAKVFGSLNGILLRGMSECECVCSLGAKECKSVWFEVCVRESEQKSNLHSVQNFVECISS